jgi:hypothetical protein
MPPGQASPTNGTLTSLTKQRCVSKRADRGASLARYAVAATGSNVRGTVMGQGPYGGVAVCQGGHSDFDINLPEDIFEEGKRIRIEIHEVQS